MADGTHIEWTDATWNPVTGCSVVSPGCTNCYAMRLAGTRLQDHPSRAGLTKPSKAGPVWTGEVRVNEQWLDQPLRWKRPRRIFVCAHADLFHENVPDEWIDRVFAVMALAPQHQFQVLTKRSKRMREYFLRLTADRQEQAMDSLTISDRQARGIVKVAMAYPLSNVWLGTSVEDQARADERIPDLLATPAAVRWISAEPLLGRFRLDHIRVHDGLYIDALAGERWHGGAGSLNSETTRGHPRLDWVVVGGESGHGSRPMHPDWARSLRDQCAAAGVHFLHKQNGDWITEDDAYDLSLPCIEQGEAPNGFYRIGKKAAGRLLDGVEHNGYPEVAS